MAAIKTNKEYKKLLENIFNVMNKGSKNLTPEEEKWVENHATMVQEYEQKMYPMETPKTLTGMIELKMYERKLNQVALAKRLKMNPAKLSLIHNGKQSPDVMFLKRIRKELKIDADFILEHI